MIKYLIMPFTLILLSSCGSSQVENVTSLDIEFDGFAEEYYNKYNLWNRMDSTKHQQILEAIDNSTVLFNCPSYRPVMWKINVNGNEKNQESKQVFKIICNTYGKLSLWRGENCYDNDSLIQLMIDIMKVDEIKNFKGEMSQSDYDLILQKKNNPRSSMIDYKR